MKIREYSVLIIGGSISLVLAIGVGFFLFLAGNRYRSVAAQLSSEIRELEGLQTRSPYPNEQNVQRAEENSRELNEAFERMVGLLASEREARPPIEPAQWPLLRQRLFGVLDDAALHSNVLLPERFAYGFERYVRTLPERRHLPRLVRQAEYIENTVQMLLDAKVHGIERIDRHLFEDEVDTEEAEDDWGRPAASARARTRRPRATEQTSAVGFSPGFSRHPGELYERERMVFAFTVREGGLWQVLNELADNDVFTVVSRLRVRNTAPRPGISEDRRPRATETRRTTARRRPTPEPMDMEPGRRPYDDDGPRRPGFPPEGPLPREERVAAGRAELLDVVMEIDFYRLQHEDRQQETPL